MASSSWQEWCEQKTSSLASQELLRSLRTVTPSPHVASTVYVDETTHRQWVSNMPSVGEAPQIGIGAPVELAMFATNDYLGLSMHPAVRSAAAAAASEHGCGPRSSALVCGYTAAHRMLESSLAALKSSEECLLFPTGYAANLAVLGALADAEDCAIFSDELNHASIIDGSLLATRRRQGASLHIYRHHDLEHLDALLSASSAPRKLIVSDSLFSMDGDYADCAGLVQLRHRHGALLCLDEAHATLVCGEHGGGAAEAAGVAHEVDVHVGTLSKAFGAHGGFVATSAPLKQLLISRGRAGIYSTALPAPVLAAASAALEHATPALRAQLRDNVDLFAQTAGLEPGGSHIVPIVVGDAAAALGASASLLRQGFHVPAIRPPTVPAGSSRLRIALSAAHSHAQITALSQALRATGVLSRRLLLFR